ncbi:MAG: hypothetical protein EPO40_16680 [Myxococcaceae bacterium]|nr:MAG: hypothetical protein EPO40_16680 [Myxococcaceae bacterium]
MSRQKGSPTPPRPGTRWRLGFDEDGQRVEMQNRGTFDEIVVGEWLHVEEMRRGSYFVQLGGACFGVTIARDGRVTVMVQEGEIEHGELVGPRMVDGLQPKPTGF